MNENKKAVIELILELMVVVFLVSLVLGSCFRKIGREEEPKQPDIATATPIITPTVTDIPTFTPTPTSTPTPEPTETPTPTPELTPTPTPTQKAVGTKGHSYKPFARHTAYNLKGSAQWALQQIAKTDERTGIRVVTDPEGVERYCVALGTYWAGAHPQHIGRCFDAIMENGAVLKCVLGDVKKQQDTKGGQNKYGAGNNDILEFIVELSKLPEAARICGDTSKVAPEFEGEVKELVVYDVWIEGFGEAWK